MQHPGAGFWAKIAPTFCPPLLFKLCYVVTKMRPYSGRSFWTTFQPSFTVSLGPKLRPPATHSLTGPQTRRLPKDPHMMHRDHPDPMRLGLLGLGWVWVGFGMVWFGLGLFWIGFGLGWAWLGSIRFDFPYFVSCPFNSAV